MLLAAALLISGCSAEKSPYESNDAAGYTISVKYDANGGTFTTNTSVIVDSYSVSDLTQSADGSVEIALLAPDNSVRGNDAFSAVKPGYFLVGWYAERTETLDSEGNSLYVYSKPWDFEKDTLTVDAGESHSSSEPVLTLYAAWAPLFEVQFYSLDSGEYLDSYTFHPEQGNEIMLPQWSEETGAIEMYKFPQRSGYTYLSAYYDAEGTQPVTGESVTHTGAVDYVNGAAKNSVMKLYVDWMEGEWYHIYNVDQFLEHASVNGSYILHADLDFTDEIWPTSLMYGSYTGTIVGNGHSLSNIVLEQTNNSKANAGLFGRLAETAVLRDLTLDHVTFTIQAGTRMAGTTFGLLAGTIASGAELDNVSIRSGVLAIDSSSYFGVDDYSIGLVCGYGDFGLVRYADVTCVAVGYEPELLSISVDGNEVTVEFAY